MSTNPQQDLRHFVRVYDGALSATWCTRMLAGFDALSAHQARNGRANFPFSCKQSNRGGIVYNS